MQSLEGDASDWGAIVLVSFVKLISCNSRREDAVPKTAMYAEGCLDQATIDSLSGMRNDGLVDG